MLGTEVLFFLRCLAAKVLIQVKSIAEGEHSEILLAFIKLQFIIKIFVYF